MTFKFISALALLLIVPSLHADWEVIQKMQVQGRDQQMTIKIKGDLIRNDMGTEMTVLADTKNGWSEAYMHANKMKVRMSAEMMQSAGALAKQFAGGDQPPVKPKATGEKVKVGEWQTEVYTWESKMGGGKFYVAAGFPKFDELSSAMDKLAKASNNPMAGLFPSNTDFPGMVVKSELTIMGQKTVSELVSATEKTLNEADFKNLEGYQEVKIPTLPGGPGK